MAEGEIVGASGRIGSAIVRFADLEQVSRTWG
jgi:hypothetical protein